jgi:hypothetical protein
MKNNNIISFKRITSVLIVLFGIIVAVTSFSGCENLLNKEEAPVVAIKISSLPAKTNYTRGETLNLSGLVVNEVRSRSNSNNDSYNYLYDFNAYISGETTDYTTTPAAGEILNETGTQTVLVERVIKNSRKRRTQRLQAKFTITVSN